MERSDKPHSPLCQDNEALQGYAQDSLMTLKKFLYYLASAENRNLSVRLRFKVTLRFVFQGPQTLCGCEEMSSVNYRQVNKILARPGFLAVHSVRI